MKKIAFLFLPFALALAAGCSQIEQDIPVIPAEEGEILIPKSFQAGVAETRTTLDGVTVLFAKDESISIWDGSGNREYKADDAGANVSFSGEVSATATEFFALSPYSAATVFSRDGSTVTAKTTLPSMQEAVPGTFASGMNISAAKSASDDSFSLENVLSVAKFTLASANLGGHQIASVELTSTSPLAGDVIVTYGETATASAGTNTVNTVTLAHSDGSALADGTYYMTLLPNAGGQITLKFTATDGFTAIKTATLKSAFEAGSIKNLGTVKGLNWEGPKYVKLTSTLSDWTGDYLLVYEAGPSVLTGVADNIGSLGAVEIGDDYAISWEDYKAYNISVEKNGSGYSLYLNGAGYLGARSGNNLLRSASVSSDAYRWSISVDGNGDVSIANLSYDRKILCNPSADRFCAYTGTSNNVKAVQFYKKSSGSGHASGPTVILTTGEATEITSAAATLNASYKGLNPVNVREVGFYWGTDAADLSESVYDNSAFTTSSGTITARISSLAAGMTYYYQVTMMVYDEASKKYVEFTGSIQSFTTLQSSPELPAGWLELPALTGNEDFVGTLYGSGGESEDNRNYSYNYNYSRFASLWVAYPLNKSHTVGEASTSNWSYNLDFDRSYQVNMTGSSYPTMYNQSNYSKGHQIPNADRKSDDLMNAQTYYVTNQTPQIQNGFNGSIWGNLEDGIRSLLGNGGETIYVATGPVYQKVGGNEDIVYFSANPDRPDAYPKTLAVPNYYWKAVLRVKWEGDAVSSASTIGFWFEHKAYNKGDSYVNYTVSVDQIEEWTGFDLFANLPDGFETAAETNKSWSVFQKF